jgi:hypothetical protein
MPLHGRLVSESLKSWRNLGAFKKMRSSSKEKEPHAPYPLVKRSATLPSTVI